MLIELAFCCRISAGGYFVFRGMRAAMLRELGVGDSFKSMRSIWLRGRDQRDSFAHRGHLGLRGVASS